MSKQNKQNPKRLKKIEKKELKITDSLGNNSDYLHLEYEILIYLIFPSELVLGKIVCILLHLDEFLMYSCTREPKIKVMGLEIVQLIFSAFLHFSKFHTIQFQEH